LLRQNVEGNSKGREIGIAGRLKLGWVPNGEPDIRNKAGKEVDTDWVQDRDNQQALARRTVLPSRIVSYGPAQSSWS
jgi:hypothetical protein